MSCTESPLSIALLTFGVFFAFTLQEKTTYGRLRVLTAPPTSVHEMAGGVTAAAGTAAAGATGSETTSER